MGTITFSFLESWLKMSKIGLIIDPFLKHCKEGWGNYFITNGTSLLPRILKQKTSRIVSFICLDYPLQPSRVALSLPPHDPSRPSLGNGMKTIDFIPYIKQSGELIPLTRSLLVTLFPSVSLPSLPPWNPNGFSINFFLARTLIRFQTNLRWRISLLEDSDCYLLFL